MQTLVVDHGPLVPVWNFVLTREEARDGAEKVFVDYVPLGTKKGDRRESILAWAKEASKKRRIAPDAC